MEALRLRLKDIDFDRLAIVVRSGKGGKDRVTIIPEPLVHPCTSHTHVLRRSGNAVRSPLARMMDSQLTGQQFQVNNTSQLGSLNRAQHNPAKPFAAEAAPTVLQFLPRIPLRFIQATRYPALAPNGQ